MNQLHARIWRWGQGDNVFATIAIYLTASMYMASCRLAGPTIMNETLLYLLKVDSYVSKLKKGCRHEAATPKPSIYDQELEALRNADRDDRVKDMIRPRPLHFNPASLCCTGVEGRRCPQHHRKSTSRIQIGGKS